MSAVNRIENGSLKLSRKLGLRICWSTGVHYRDLMANTPGVPQTRNGDLTKESFEAMAQAVAAIDDVDQVLQSLILNAATRADLLYQALNQAPCGRTKMWAMDAAIMEAFEFIEKEFGLSKRVDKLRLGDSGKIKIQVVQTARKPTRDKTRIGTNG
jgi:hypothetical protein